MIKIKNLYFTYGGEFELNIEKLHIKEGEIVSIIGPNGSGKSTLIKILSGIIGNYNGNIEVENKNLSDFNKKNLSKKLSVVPQEFNTIFDFDVESIVSTGRLPFSKSILSTETHTDKVIINNALKSTDLLKYKNYKFSHLSGGEKQRVMIARSLAQQTKVMLLDEISSHLDPGHTQSLMNLVSNIARNKNKTVLSIFHDINLSAIFSKRIIIFKDGEIMADGTPNEIIKEDIVEKAYNLKAYILKHPELNVPQVLFK